jgi:hypothetical protein
MADLFDVPAVRPADSEDALIKMVLDKDMGIEVLERIIALKNQEYERKALADFEENFRKLQAEMPIIKKIKEATNASGKKMYSFAPLEEIQKQCNKFIAKHGFSYCWREEAIESGIKRVWLKISGWGHSKENYFDIPPVSISSMTNAAQNSGVQSTYGKRYTLISGFGIIVEDEDTDGNFSIQDFGEYRDLLAPLYDAKTSTELIKAANDIKAKIAPNDHKAKEMCNQVYMQRRKEMQ